MLAMAPGQIGCPLKSHRDTQLMAEIPGQAQTKHGDDDDGGDDNDDDDGDDDDYHSLFQKAILPHANYLGLRKAEPICRWKTAKLETRHNNKVGKNCNKIQF